MDAAELRIPDIRERLHALAMDRADIPMDVRQELVRLAEATKRRIIKRTGRVVSKKITDLLAAEIRSFVRHNPRLTYAEVGRRFGVAGGRISEIMHGRKGERPDGQAQG